MVCIRCEMVVKTELDKLGLHFVVVDLGEFDIKEDITKEQKVKLNTALLKSGLELMDDHRAILVEKIKSTIIELVHDTETQIKVKLSDFLADKLKYDYTYLANLFSEVKGTTIENFYLTLRIEKVKELIIYDEFSLTEIAYNMHYSSVAHLSNQFKKYTGLTPSYFKKFKNKRRNTLEEL